MMYGFNFIKESFCYRYYQLQKFFMSDSRLNRFIQNTKGQIQNIIKSVNVLL